MPRPTTRVVSMNEVRITKENGDTAFFKYCDQSMGNGMHLKIGPEIHSMTDLDLLEAHNAVVTKMIKMRDSYENVVTEIPHGRPQIEYSKGSSQWVPRGEVLRCYIDDDGEEDEESVATPVIEIDDKRLSLKEFGRMLNTYSGWGMRILFVPNDRLLESPKIRIEESLHKGQKNF